MRATSRTTAPWFALFGKGVCVRCGGLAPCFDEWVERHLPATGPAAGQSVAGRVGPMSGLLRCEPRRPIVQAVRHQGDAAAILAWVLAASLDPFVAGEYSEDGAAGRSAGRWSGRGTS